MSPPAARERVLDAAYECIARFGMGHTTVEDVGRQAGVSRATVYRHFPGGRAELERAVVARQVAVFFEELAVVVAGREAFADLMVDVVTFSATALRDHAVLQKVLQSEPERLLPVLTVEGQRLLGLVRRLLAVGLATAPLREGVVVEEAADYVARMLLSHIASPGGRDLTDATVARELVCRQFLAGVLAD